MLDFSMLIGGEEVTGKDKFNVTNPATGEIVGSAANATLDDLDRAVASAKAAFPAWAGLPDAERQAIVAKLAGVLEENAEEIARVLTQEQGKPLGGVGSRVELGASGAWAGYTASLEMPVKVLQDTDEGRIELHRKPVGVVGSITPWNWPVMIAIWHVVPALRAGNTVVIKPSPYTPLSTLMVVKLLNKVLPKGVLNVITSDDKETNIGAAMSAHPDIRKIVFTGSCGTGQKVMETAARTMKRLTLELGGNDAGIVLPDVDPKAIAENLFWGIFINSGQTCASMKRLYVHDDIHDEVCEALVDYARNIKVGNGLEDDSVLGPVNNQMQFDVVSRLVEAGAKEGNVLLGGAPDEGLFYPLTVISELTSDNPLVAKEQFGPAIPVIRFTDVDEAIEQANASENGLGGSIWSKDLDRAKDLALKLECGSAWVNRHGTLLPFAPFGGVKSSGLGVEFGEEGLFENTDIQSVHIHS